MICDFSARMSHVEELLSRTGINVADFEVEKCTEGGNNKVLKVLAGGRQFLAKWYVNDPMDCRNRLSGEWNFLKCAAQAGIQQVPRPYAVAEENNVALYEFIEGDTYRSEDITATRIEEAESFIRALNSATMRTTGRLLATASEACFSIDAHISLVQARLQRLVNIEALSEEDVAATRFIQELSVFWEQLKSVISTACGTRGIDMSRELSESERCISPSDFGFHNALLSNSKSTFFIDFEYAGWDDPAKLYADFFLQPALPVARKYKTNFRSAVLSHIKTALKDYHEFRAELLWELVGVKWCCIILNPFIAGWSNARFKDDSKQHLRTLKHNRLQRAQRAFSELSIHSGVSPEYDIHSKFTHF